MKNFELVIARGGLRAARAIKSYREVRRRRPDRTAVERERSSLPPPGAVEALLARRDDRCPFAENATFYRDHDVEVLLEATATAVDAGLGGDDRLSYLETKSGLCVEAEFAVVGVGVVPNVDFLADSGLALDNGVVVNQRFETNVPGVYAAGDVASFFDPLYGRPAANRGLVERELPGDRGRQGPRGRGSVTTPSPFFSEVFGTLKHLIAEDAPMEALERELVGGRSR